jgi:hypothetical protein
MEISSFFRLIQYFLSLVYISPYKIAVIFPLPPRRDPLWAKHCVAEDESENDSDAKRKKCDNISISRPEQVAEEEDEDGGKTLKSSSK